MIHFDKDYYHINCSFTRKVVFRVGLDAGFFSEYNNMILAMAWCLKNKYQFQLYSYNANFGFENGWTDFFIPFCTEKFNRFHFKYNHRPYPYGKNKYYPFFVRVLFKFNLLKVKFDYTPPFQLIKRRLGIGDLLTQDIFALVRSQNTTEEIEIPELGFKDNLRSLCKYLTQVTWKFNIETQLCIDEMINALNLPDKYIGFHIRGGDKLIEYPKMLSSSYINKAEKISDTRSAFVLTDDYRIINDLKVNYPTWDFYTLCQPDEIGYYHSEFLKLSLIERKKSYIRLFSSMVINERASHFIGTFSSNPGMFLGMRMSPKHCHAIDFDEWQIW